MNAAGNLIVRKATINGVAYWGGVGSLDATQVHSAIDDIRPVLPTRTQFIVGTTDASNTAGLDTSKKAAVLRKGCFRSPLANQLTSVGWHDVFADDNDGIVGANSQRIGVGTPLNVPGVIHSDGTASLGFNGPSELSSNSLTPTHVLNL